ncbi:hypothetical protein LQZ19_04460 [Treponema primitia]|uniref:hypothetical protein n=1 Tax=Treponema primitia TaxID=88058 RepID=UPI003980C96B
MNIEIIKLRNFQGNPSSIDLALPIIAFECEAYIPQDNELDAYQEAVLKLVSIGLAENGIRNTLGITQSLCGDIFNTLKDQSFLNKENSKWELSEKATKALYNTNTNEISDTSRFGYMFLSAIKKDPFWFFYEGDIHTLPLSDQSLLYK